MLNVSSRLCSVDMVSITFPAVSVLSGVVMQGGHHVYISIGPRYQAELPRHRHRAQSLSIQPE